MSTFANFAKGTVLNRYGATDGTILLSEGDTDRFPSPPFNATWWNSLSYPNAADDPGVEIVTVTGISGDYMTIIRGAEGTAASAKNTANARYSIAQSITARTLDQLLTRNVTSDFAIANARAYFRHQTTGKYHEVFIDENTGVRTIRIDDEPKSSITITQIDTGSLYGNSAAMNGEWYLKNLTSGLYHKVRIDIDGAARVLVSTDQSYSSVSANSFPNGTFSGEFSIVNGHAYLKADGELDWREIYLDEDDFGNNTLFISDELYS